jgi:hypothetical protein
MSSSQPLLDAAGPILFLGVPWSDPPALPDGSPAPLRPPLGMPG